MQQSGKLKITQVRGSAGKRQRHKLCLKGLGLRKIRHSVIREDTKCIRGLIKKVHYLVEFEEITEPVRDS